MPYFDLHCKLSRKRNLAYGNVSHQSYIDVYELVVVISNNISEFVNLTLKKYCILKGIT